MTDQSLPLQTYKLKWANHSNNIVQTLIEQFEDEGLVDVTLTCEGQFIKAHKVILSACSPFFKELFRQYKVAHPCVILNNVTFYELSLIIRFMYEGEVKVQEKEMDALLTVAESLQIKGLSKLTRQKQPEPEQMHIDEIPTAPINGTVNQPVRKRRKQSLSPINKKIDVPIEDLTRQTNDEANKSCDQGTASKCVDKDAPKIPRPPNAFMIFAHEWRRKLAAKYTTENNKEISVRLGNVWKSFSACEKNVWYNAAKRASEAHKLKYPGYQYSPKESKRKRQSTEISLTNLLKTSQISMPGTSLIYEVNSDDEAEVVEDVEEIPNKSPPVTL